MRRRPKRRPEIGRDNIRVVGAQGWRVPEEARLAAQRSIRSAMRRPGGEQDTMNNEEER